jgi:Tol biopolymer transport system component
MTRRLPRLVSMLVTATLVGSCVSASGVRSPGVSRLTSSRFLEVAWSSDSSKLLGTSLLHADGTSDLLRVSLSDGEIKQVSLDPNVYSLPTWSQDALAAVAVGVTEIWLVDVETGDFSLFADGEGAAFSPDGESVIVYTSGNSIPGLEQRELRFVDLEGQVIRTLPLHLRDLTSPGPWERVTSLGVSPDSMEVLVGLADFGPDPDEYRAYIVDVQTGAVDRILAEQRVASAHWSPSGDRLAYVSTNGASGLGQLVISLTDGTCAFRPDLPPEVGAFSWSPDGGNIAFVLRGSVYVLDLKAAGFDPAAGGC